MATTGWRDKNYASIDSIADIPQELKQKLLSVTKDKTLNQTQQYKKLAEAIAGFSGLPAASRESLLRNLSSSLTLDNIDKGTLNNITNNWISRFVPDSPSALAQPTAPVTPTTPAAQPWEAPNTQYLPPGAFTDVGTAFPYFPGPKTLDFNPEQNAALNAMWGQGNNLMGIADRLGQLSSSLPNAQQVQQQLQPLYDMASKLPGYGDQAVDALKQSMGQVQGANSQFQGQLQNLISSANLMGNAQQTGSNLQSIANQLSGVGQTGYNQLQGLSNLVMPQIQDYLSQLQGKAGDISQLGQGLVPQALSSMGQLQSVANRLGPQAQSYANKLNNLAAPLMPEAYNAASVIANMAERLNPIASQSAANTQESLNDFNQRINQAMGFMDVANNPYVNNYANSIANQITRQAMLQLPGVTSAAVDQGAYGGVRSAFQQDQVLKDANQAIADQMAQIYNNAYGQGMGAFQQALGLMPTATELASRPGDIMSQAAQQTASMYGQIPGILQNAAGQAGNLYGAAQNMLGQAGMNQANILAQLPAIYQNAIGQQGSLEGQAANILGQLPGIFSQGVGQTSDLQSQAAQLLSQLQGQSASIQGQIPGLLQSAAGQQANLYALAPQLANQAAELYSSMGAQIPQIYGNIGTLQGNLLKQPFDIINTLAQTQGSLGQMQGLLGTGGTTLLGQVGDIKASKEAADLAGQKDEWNYYNNLNGGALTQQTNQLSSLPVGGGTTTSTGQATQGGYSGSPLLGGLGGGLSGLGSGLALSMIPGVNIGAGSLALLAGLGGGTGLLSSLGGK